MQSSFHPSAARGVVAWAAAATVVFFGCGSRLDLPPLSDVSGTVTVNGEPVPRGMVQFIPDTSKGTVGTPATGFIDADGRYTLKTAGQRGAMVGFHRVRVEARAEPRDETDTLPALIIPPKYTQENTSGLDFEVKAGEDNVINLELRST